MDGTSATATTTAVARPGAWPGFEQVRSVLEAFRLADRSASTDEDRLLWVDEIRDLGRRVTALTAVLVAEAPVRLRLAALKPLEEDFPLIPDPAPDAVDL